MIIAGAISPGFRKVGGATSSAGRIDSSTIRIDSSTVRIDKAS